jgi:hypothetical protein
MQRFGETMRKTERHEAFSREHRSAARGVQACELERVCLLVMWGLLVRAHPLFTIFI